MFLNSALVETLSMGRDVGSGGDMILQPMLQQVEDKKLGCLRALFAVELMLSMVFSDVGGRVVTISS